MSIEASIPYCWKGKEGSRQGLCTNTGRRAPGPRVPVTRPMQSPCLNFLIYETGMTLTFSQGLTGFQDTQKHLEESLVHNKNSVNGSCWQYFLYLYYFIVSKNT